MSLTKSMRTEEDRQFWSHVERLPTMFGPLATTRNTKWDDGFWSRRIPVRNRGVEMVQPAALIHPRARTAEALLSTARLTPHSSNSLLLFFSRFHASRYPS